MYHTQIGKATLKVNIFMSRFHILKAGWSVLSPSESYRALKTMKEYKKTHPRCELTGSDKKVQIHHIQPVWACPERAADPTNMVSLSTSANVHLLFGHDGVFKNKYVSNIKEICEQVAALKSQSQVVHRVEAQSVRPSRWWKGLFAKILMKLVDI